MTPEEVETLASLMTHHYEPFTTAIRVKIDGGVSRVNPEADRLSRSKGIHIGPYHRGSMNIGLGISDLSKIPQLVKDLKEVLGMI